MFHYMLGFNPLSANTTKWSKTLKQYSDIATASLNFNQKNVLCYEKLIYMDIPSFE